MSFPGHLRPDSLVPRFPPAEVPCQDNGPPPFSSAVGPRTQRTCLRKSETACATDSHAHSHKCQGEARDSLLLDRRSCRHSRNKRLTRSYSIDFCRTLKNFPGLSSRLERQIHIRSTESSRSCDSLRDGRGWPVRPIPEPTQPGNPPIWTGRRRYVTPLPPHEPISPITMHCRK
jgi:hypothetical protein